MPGYSTAGPALVQKPLLQPNKRFNLFAICASTFVPWTVFCVFCQLNAFELAYKDPGLVDLATYLAGAALVIGTLMSLLVALNKVISGQLRKDDPTWVLFMLITSLVYFILALILASSLFKIMSQYYDISQLNTYQSVNPATMRGQEIMDAGTVSFRTNVSLDTRFVMSFKNDQTYCVVPITGVTKSPNVVLASYDFWAVGKNCCDEGANFTCGAYNDPTASSGLRIVVDADRAFYRLAVQQAQSTYNIKASHPLFFEWVSDPATTLSEIIQQCWQTYIVAMLAVFGGHLLLVWFAATVYAKLYDTVGP